MKSPKRRGGWDATEVPRRQTAVFRVERAGVKIRRQTPRKIGRLPRRRTTEWTGGMHNTREFPGAGLRRDGRAPPALAALLREPPTVERVDGQLKNCNNHLHGFCAIIFRTEVGFRPRPSWSPSSGPIYVTVCGINKGIDVDFDILQLSG